MAIKTFTTGEVLTASDTNTYPANSGLVYIATKTWTSVSADQQLDNCFSSTYDNYRIVFNGTGNQSTPTVVFLRYVDGTTPDAVATYAYTESIVVGGPSTSLYFSGASATSTGVGFVGDTQSSFSCDIYSPNLASNTTSTSHCNVFGTVNYRNGQITGTKLTTTQYEGIFLGRGAGSWAGTLTVYGYRKA